MPRTYRSPLTFVTRASAASLIVFGLGCSSTSDPVDVGLARPDAGLTRPDAAVADAAEPDAAEPDATEPDAMESDAAPSDAGVADAEPTDAGEPTCSTNPMTHREIINACTDAEFVQKQVTLPLLNPDGTLPPLP